MMSIGTVTTATTVIATITTTTAERDAAVS
jgi:hypothetical protein